MVVEAGVEEPGSVDGWTLTQNQLRAQGLLEQSVTSQFLIVFIKMRNFLQNRLSTVQHQVSTDFMFPFVLDT